MTTYTTGDLASLELELEAATRDRFNILPDTVTVEPERVAFGWTPERSALGNVIDHLGLAALLAELHRSGIVGPNVAAVWVGLDSAGALTVWARR